jgi:hypothetical protein
MTRGTIVPVVLFSIPHVLLEDRGFGFAERIHRAFVPCERHSQQEGNCDEGGDDFFHGGMRGLYFLNVQKQLGIFLFNRKNARFGKK